MVGLDGGTWWWDLMVGLDVGLVGGTLDLIVGLDVGLGGGTWDLMWDLA